MIDSSLREDRPVLDDATLRQFAGLWTVVFLGLAGYHGLFRDRPTLGVALAALALLAGLPGIVKPQSIRLLFAAAMALAMPIGWVVSHALLAVIFYLVITPLAFVFRLSGRDVLRRRSGKGNATHWTERRQPTDPRRYLDQS